MSVEPRLFICVGAQKAGTTWLHSYLDDHPSVHVPTCKEMHYFGGALRGTDTPEAQARRQQLDRLDASLTQRLLYQASRAKRSLKRDFPRPSLAELRALVAMHDQPDPTHQRYWRALTLGRSTETVVADISPGYDQLLGKQYAAILRAFPQTRFLYILRDPVERSVSNAHMHYKTLCEDSDPPSYNAFIDEVVAGKHRHLIARSRYLAGMERLRRGVPEDRRLVLFYETLFNDAAMTRLCDFLDVPFRTGRYGQVVFSQAKLHPADQRLRDQLRPRFENIYAHIAKWFGDEMPAAWDYPRDMRYLPASVTRTVARDADAG